MQAGWQSKASFGIRNAPDFKTCTGETTAVAVAGSRWTRGQPARRGGRRRIGGGAGRSWWLWEWLCEVGSSVHSLKKRLLRIFTLSMVLLLFYGSTQRPGFCAKKTIDWLCPRQRGVPLEDLDHDGSCAGRHWFVSG